MPFKSHAQQRFAHANPEKFGGERGLKEWDHATDFSRLPERKHRAKKAKRVRENRKETIYGSPSASGTTPHLRN